MKWITREKVQVDRVAGNVNWNLMAKKFFRSKRLLERAS